MTANTLYDFILEGSAAGGGTLPSPYLQLRDSNGVFITGFDDHLTYIPVSSGIYYLAAQGNFNTLGSYTLCSQVDDYVGGIGTSGNLAMNGSVTGVIQNATDTDWSASPSPPTPATPFPWKAATPAAAPWPTRCCACATAPATSWPATRTAAAAAMRI